MVSNQNMTFCYEQDVDLYMSSYEDTGTKSMFITHLGRLYKLIGK